jgi:hypothetical protein
MSTCWGRQVREQVLVQLEVGRGAVVPRTTTDYRPNTANHVVDRPARQEVVERCATTRDEWQRLAATEYIYDDNSAWDSRTRVKPPAPAGAFGQIWATPTPQARR